MGGLAEADEDEGGADAVGKAVARCAFISSHLQRMMRDFQTLGWADVDWDGGAAEAGGAELALSPLERASASDLSCAFNEFLSERSTGFETSSKLDVSSSPSSVSASSLSANFDARLAIELVCSVMDGAGPRNEGKACGASFIASGSCFVGECGRGETGAFEAGL